MLLTFIDIQATYCSTLVGRIKTFRNGVWPNRHVPRFDTTGNYRHYRKHLCAAHAMHKMLWGKKCKSRSSWLHSITPSLCEQQQNKLVVALYCQVLLLTLLAVIATGRWVVNWNKSDLHVAHMDFKATAAVSFSSPEFSQAPNPVDSSDPWVSSLALECPYYGPDDGLFHPSVRHPRFIVTGGAGFIGSHLVKQLVKSAGPGQVKVIDNFSNGQMARFQRQNGSWILNPQRDVCAIDLTVQGAALKYLRGADYVYHLAYTAVQGDKAAEYNQNVLIDDHTLSACMANHIKHFIYVGTSMPAAATATSNIQELGYLQAKRMGEYEAQTAQSDWFNVGIVRLNNVYGPGSDATHLIPSLLQQAVDRQPLVVDATSKLDLLYVGDAVAALLSMKERGLNQGPLEISAGYTISKQHLADVATCVVHRNASGCKPTPMAVMGHAHKVLGWQPRFSLVQGVAATLKWLESTNGRTKVLVVLTGQPRGGELAWRSLHKHVVLPNNAHLATYFTPIGGDTSVSMIESMAQYAWRVPEPPGGDWGVAMDQAAAMCPRPDLRWYTLCADGNKYWGGGFKKCPNHTSMSGTLLAYRWLLGRRIAALNLHKQYEHIIFTRPDYLYLCNPPLVAELNASLVWVPDGEGWGGYCDRYLAGTSDNLRVAINITQELVCNLQRYLPVVRRGSVRNSETLHAQVWHRVGVNVGTFPFSMFTVRSRKDPSSFAASSGYHHPELARVGLKYKYSGEFNATIAHCNVSNLTSRLLDIQQHPIKLFL